MNILYIFIARWSLSESEMLISLSIPSDTTSSMLPIFAITISSRKTFSITTSYCSESKGWPRLWVFMWDLSPRMEKKTFWHFTHFFASLRCDFFRWTFSLEVDENSNSQTLHLNPCPADSTAGPWISPKPGWSFSWAWDFMCFLRWFGLMKILPHSSQILFLAVTCLCICFSSRVFSLNTFLHLSQACLGVEWVFMWWLIFDLLIILAQLGHCIFT